MFKLRYLDQAKQDFRQIAEDIARRSGSIETALDFVGKLDSRCQDLADKPFKLGQPRHDLGINLHSKAISEYVVFFRYD